MIYGDKIFHDYTLAGASPQQSLDHEPSSHVNNEATILPKCRTVYDLALTETEAMEVQSSSADDA